MSVVSSHERSTRTRRGALDRGFSLIEVLVALIVLAIGLLGLASLQARGLKFNQDAYIRSQATTLAYDIMDRMRADRGNALDFTTAVSGDPGLACDPTVGTIAMDLSCWYDAIAATLPAGAATIVQQAAPNDRLYDVTIAWYDRESDTTKTQVWTVWP